MNVTDSKMNLLFFYPYTKHCKFTGMQQVNYLLKPLHVVFCNFVHVNFNTKWKWMSRCVKYHNTVGDLDPPPITWWVSQSKCLSASRKIFSETKQTKRAICGYTVRSFNRKNMSTTEDISASKCTKIRYGESSSKVIKNQWETISQVLNVRILKRIQTRTLVGSSLEGAVQNVSECKNQAK